MSNIYFKVLEEHLDIESIYSDIFSKIDISLPQFQINPLCENFCVNYSSKSDDGCSITLMDVHFPVLYLSPYTTDRLVI